jgi:hypothetical protein
MKKNILSVLFMIIALSAQSQQKSHGFYTSKYWNYRYALRGDDSDPSYRKWEPGFLEVGGGNGFSMPMRYRVRIEEGTNNPINTWSYLYSHTTPDRKNQGLLQGLAIWKDVPTDFGKYMVVLATEFELLYRDAAPNGSFNWNTIKQNDVNLYKQMKITYDEMKFAVDAYWRMDCLGETYLGQGPSCNGFFVRDDVPLNFAEDGKFGMASQKMSNYWNGNANSTYYKGNNFANVQSNFVGFHYNNFSDPQNPGPPQTDQFVESQDQLIKLLLGLIYMKKYTANLRNNSQDYHNLHNLLHGMIDRTLWYIFPDYVIGDPRGGSVPVGSSALMVHSAPLWGIYNRYGDGNFQGWAATLAATVGEPSWNFVKSGYTFSYPFGSFPGQYFNHEMYGYCAIMDDRSAMFIPNSLHLFGENLAEEGEKPYEYHINALSEALRGTLHSNLPVSFSVGMSPPTLSLNFRNFSNTDFEKFLNHRYFECLHQTRDYNEDPHIAGQKFELNGLDYMIAHNLYRLNYPANSFDVASNKFRNIDLLYKRIVNQSFPLTGSYNKFVIVRQFPLTIQNNQFNFTIGTKDNPVMIEAADSIYAENAIFTPTSKGTIRAPHIVLKSGFNAQFGSVCDIYNERMDCNDYQYVTSTEGVQVPYKSISESTSNNLESKLDLFPNPASKNVNLLLSNYQNTSVNIKIFDLMGREMQEVIEKNIPSREHTLDLDIERLAPGTYIVKVNNGFDEKATKLVVVRY